MQHLRRVFPYMARYRGAYAFGLTLTVLATACGTAAPLIVRHAIDRMEIHTHDDSSAIPSITPELILTLAGAVLLFAVVRGALLVIGRVRLLSASRHIETDLRNDLFAHLERLPAGFYDGTSAGDLTSRAINDIEGVRMMIGASVQYLASTGLLVIASLAAMFALQPALAALCLIPLALISLVMNWAGRRIHHAASAVQDQLGLISGRAQENLSGTRVVRAFVQEENEIARFRGDCDEYRTRSLRLVHWRALCWAAVFLLAEVAIFVTLLAGGTWMMDGTLTRGDFVAFTAYQFMLVWPMIAVGWVFNLIQRGLACLKRIIELLDTPAAPDPTPHSPTPPPIRGLIEAKNLDFSYVADRPPALSGISLRIEPGQTVLLAGRTGSGKSTLTRLLLRLYRPPDGTLFIDGRDVNTLPAAELRAALGVVPQDLFLFSDTLRENIALGGQDGCSEEDIVRVAGISGLARDVEAFPDRYEQLIGERGVTLSGGQKQRTALARALLRDPRILILDDAFSSVDADTERGILDRLRDFAKERTCLVITHRLSAFRDADRIFVLDEGRLVEEGRHEDLLARGGRYARLWERQMLEEELSQP